MVRRIPRIFGNLQDGNLLKGAEPSNPQALNMKRIPTLATTLALLAAGAPALMAQNRNTVPLFNVASGAGTTEVCVSGDYAYQARGSAGVSVVRISGAGAPSLAGTIQPYQGMGNTDIQDVEAVGNILYVGNDVPNNSATPHTGLFMYDLAANPVNPPLVGTITWGAGPNLHLGASLHNFCIDVSGGRTYAYIASAISNAVEVFDVTNPALPEYKDALRPPAGLYGLIWGSVHDVTVRNGVCVSTWLDGGFAVHDVSNIAASHLDFQLEELVSATSLLNYTKYANANTYHASISENGQWLVTTDGRSTIGCRTWNLASITGPTVPLVHTSQFTSPTGTVIHRAEIKGKYVYASNFMDGCRILELTPAGLLREVGRHDTTPTTGGTGYNGVWSLALDGEKILLSDTVQGLFAIDFRDSISVTAAEWKRSTGTLTLEATSTASPSVSLVVNGYGTMNWNANLGKYQLVVGGVNNYPSSITVTSDIGGSQTAAVRKR